METMKLESQKKFYPQCIFQKTKTKGKSNEMCKQGMAISVV